MNKQGLITMGSTLGVGGSKNNRIPFWCPFMKVNYYLALSDYEAADVPEFKLQMLLAELFRN